MGIDFGGCRVGWLIAAAVLAVGLMAMGDTVETHDGTVYTGKVIMRGPELIVVGEDGTETVLRQTEVARVVIGQAGPKPGPQTQPGNDFVMGPAEKALAEYQNGSTHYGDATAAANEALKADEKNVLALTVLGLVAYRTGDAAQAREWFLKVAAADPKNVGVLNNLAVIAMLPTSAFAKPFSFFSTQNLAQKMAQQNAPMDAIKYFTAALAAEAEAGTKAEAGAGVGAGAATGVRVGPEAPAEARELARREQARARLAAGAWPGAEAADVQLADNVTYELDLITPKAGPAYTKLHDLYATAEKEVEAEMLKKNQCRWGTGWVSSQNLYGLQSNLEDTQNKMTALQQKKKIDTANLDGDVAQQAELQRKLNALPSDDPRDARQISAQMDMIGVQGDRSAVDTDNEDIGMVQVQLDGIHAKAFVPPRAPIIEPARMWPEIPRPGQPRGAHVILRGQQVEVAPATGPVNP